MVANIQPGVGDAHVDKLLTNISVQYKNQDYIAGQIFPTVLVEKQSDRIAKYTKSFWARSVARKLGPLEAPDVSGYAVDYSDVYFCDKRGIGDVIPDESVANTDLPFDAEADAAEWVADQLLLEQELDFLTNFWKTGVWGTDKTGGADFTKWSDLANSDPIEDLRVFGRTVRRALLGRRPNTLVLGDLTFDVLQDHPDLLDRVKYSSSNDMPAMVTPNLLAQLLGLEQVLVGYVVYTTTPEGQSSVTYTAGYDDDAWLGYVAPSPALRTPSAGYRFVWRTVFGGQNFIKRRRDPISDAGWLIEGYNFYQHKGLATDAGLFIADAVD